MTTCAPYTDGRSRTPPTHGFGTRAADRSSSVEWAWWESNPHLTGSGPVLSAKLEYMPEMRSPGVEPGLRRTRPSTLRVYLISATTALKWVSVESNHYAERRLVYSQLGTRFPTPDPNAQGGIRTRIPFGLSKRGVPITSPGRLTCLRFQGARNDEALSGVLPERASVLVRCASLPGRLRLAEKAKIRPGQQR